MNPKTWLTVYGIAAVLALAGSGFFAFSSFGRYSEAMEGWDSKVGQIESLERRVPYPSNENAKELEARMESYRKSVDDLSGTLKSSQRELKTELRNTDFQQQVKRRVEEFRAAARSGGLTIESSTEFQLGFDSYANTLPAPEIVAILDYELDAIDHLLRKLIDSGVEMMTSFERDLIPGESGSSQAQDSGLVHKYPVRLRFRGSFDSIQQFINGIANDKEFFYIVRVLKVRNDVVEGPAKLIADVGNTFKRFQNPETKEVASPAMLEEWGEGEVSDAELAAKAREAGFLPANQDARVLMGQEKLNVFMVVDITRFLSPDEVTESAPEPEARRTGKR